MSERAPSNPRIPLVALVFPVPSLSAGNPREVFDDFYADNVLRVLVSELTRGRTVPFNSYAKRVCGWNASSISMLS
jgi:hypothetical protein